jgi:hypothetical protein
VVSRCVLLTGNQAKAFLSFLLADSFALRFLLRLKHGQAIRGVALAGGTAPARLPIFCRFI